MQRRKFIQTGLVATPLSMSGITLVEVGANTLPVENSFVVKAGQDRFNEPIKYRGISPNLVKISARDTGGQFSVFEYEGFAKMGPDLHVHLKQDETFYILEGEYIFQVGEQKHTLVAGDTIFLPRNIAHTWLQLTDKGKLMYMLQPAGKMEEFFKKMNLLKGIPTQDEINKIHLAHDLRVLGPPLSL
jgi:quercetin 2,3-dioxygenase